MATSWRRRQGKVKTVFEKIFDDRVASIYDGNGMAGWAKGTKSKDGKTWTRPPQNMPFTKLEFSIWLLAQLGNKRDGVIQCAYCNAFLDISTLVIDHKESKKRGGSLGFSNMCCACASCNSRKGVMSEDGFRKLIHFSLTLDPRDASDMFSRLAQGSGYLRLMLQGKSGKRKAAPATGRLL